MAARAGMSTLCYAAPSTSLRAKQSNPSRRAKEECIASLAITTWLLPPNLVRHIHRELQLRPLLLLGQDGAFLGRCKAALRGHGELLERREFGGLHQPSLDVFLVLEFAELRGDDADPHDLVAF